MTGPVLGGFREAAKYTGLSRRTLARLLPEIGHLRVGSRVLFTKSALDAFLARHMVRPRPERKIANARAVVDSVRRRRAGR